MSSNINDLIRDAKRAAKGRTGALPEEQKENTAKRRFKRRNSYRNQPCPCGSGKKFKKCCW